MTLHPEIAEAFSLEGKVAVVMGAGSGIGAECARILALAGAPIPKDASAPVVHYSC